MSDDDPDVDHRDNPDPDFDPKHADGRAETSLSYEELVAYLDGELDELAVRRLRARIALDPAAARKLATLRSLDSGVEQLRAEHARRLAANPDLVELEMSDEATDRISAAIEAEVTRQQADRHGGSTGPEQR